MNGVVIEQMSSPDDALLADAVIVGSGVATREVVEDDAIKNVLRRLDSSRQLIAAPMLGSVSVGPPQAAERRAGLYRPDYEAVGGRGWG